MAPATDVQRVRFGPMGRAQPSQVEMQVTGRVAKKLGSYCVNLSLAGAPFSCLSVSDRAAASASRNCGLLIRELVAAWGGKG